MSEYQAHWKSYRNFSIAHHNFDPFAELEAAAHARGVAEGRGLQVEEDAQIVRNLSGCSAGYIADRIEAEAAKIGDSNDQS